jgi:uncharacterized protein YjbJ (UPF0337 family)
MQVEDEAYVAIGRLECAFPYSGGIAWPASTAAGASINKPASIATYRFIKLLKWIVATRAGPECFAAQGHAACSNSDGGFFIMNWNEVEGKWNQLKGTVREKFGKLTDDDIQVIAGKKDQFLGKLQERYGIARAQAEKELDTWLHSQHETGRPRTRTTGGGT